MTPVVTAELVSAIFVGIVLLGQQNNKFKSESTKWLRVCAASIFFYLLIDAASEFDGVDLPFIVSYIVNFLSYVAGGIVLIFFTKYCEGYISEITKQKEKVYWIPIALYMLFIVCTAVEFFCGQLVVYKNGIEVAWYDYPIWVRIIMIAGMVCASIIAISKWKSIGVKSVVLIGIFILVPAIASALAIPTGVDTSVICGAIAVSLIVTIMQRNHIEEQQKQLAETKALADTDALTHVKSDLSYTTIRGRINDDIKEKRDLAFAIVFCDINGLKNVNDTHGHEVGDIYIQNCCKIICDVYDRSPVYRVGGDEFIALLQKTDYENRDELFNTLHEKIKEAEAIEKVEDGKASFSAGMAVFDPSKDLDVRDVQGRADAAMYQEKGSSRR